MLAPRLDDVLELIGVDLACIRVLNQIEHVDLAQLRPENCFELHLNADRQGSAVRKPESSNIFNLKNSLVQEALDLERGAWEKSDRRVYCACVGVGGPRLVISVLLLTPECTLWNDI